MFWCFQSKHQKHQAFEAELHANADRIRGVIDMGNSLIDRGACAGSEDAVKVWAPAPLLLAGKEEALDFTVSIRVRLMVTLKLSLRKVSRFQSALLMVLARAAPVSLFINLAEEGFPTGRWLWGCLSLTTCFSRLGPAGRLS